jgi:ribosomal-protein-alanine N-acetyltransferase
MMKLWMAPHGLHIEPGRGTDAETMATLHAQGFFRGWPRQDFDSFLAEAGTPAYVACDAKRKIAGFALLRVAADEAELITIAVDQKWRRMGVGSALMRAIFDDLATTAARRLFLEVAADNPAAIRLYKGFGFVQTGERQAYYARPDGRPASALVMTRDLG